jgi:hypothetical protein
MVLRKNWPENVNKYDLHYDVVKLKIHGFVLNMTIYRADSSTTP